VRFAGIDWDKPYLFKGFIKVCRKNGEFGRKNAGNWLKTGNLLPF
jgi:hypothetical protein